MTEEFGMDEVLGQSVDTKSGSVVEGVVVGQQDANLIVNVGLKQEAFLPLKEFSTAPPAVGEKIFVLILRLGGPEGRPLVSWKQAKERLHWDRILDHFHKNEVLDGKVTQRIKGGVLVDIGLDAFMPASQIDEKPVAKPEEWVGKSIQVLVLEMDRAKGNVLVSRRKVQEVEKAARREKTLSSLQIGQVVSGRVTNLTNFGAFVDIGGIEGLLHNTDIAWGRVDHPKHHLKIGDQLDIKVIKYDAATHRISLGRKQLLPHPWDGIENRYPPGSKVTGKVTGLAAFGAFVEIEPGVEGLIHISELSWEEDVKDPKAILKPKQVIETVVIGIDRAKEKISLSLKRLGTNPWEEVARTHPVGTQVEGDVTHITNFGAFVRLAKGVEGLLKTGDLSWTERYQSPHQILKVGDKIKAVVLDINLKEEKISLGLKQMTTDPLKLIKKGQVVSGKIVRSGEFGVIVKLESGVEGLVRSNELFLKKSIFNEPKPFDTKVETEPTHKVGEEVQAVVTLINKKERSLELSIRRYEQGQERELLKKYSGQTGNPTLGEATGWIDQEGQE